MRRLEIEVVVRPLPLSARSKRALMHAIEYDLVVFTSKNAKKIFDEWMRAHGAQYPERAQTKIVGPRMDLLKLSVRGKRILFPRSKIAPFDIVRLLRARGTIVQPVVMYSSHGKKLDASTMRALLRGDITDLYFKSPSGVEGLLKQLSKEIRKNICAIPVHCIGETTARAAKIAGFKKVSAQRIL